MSDSEILKVLRVVDVDGKHKHVAEQHPPQTEIKEMVSIQTEALKQVAVVLNKFIRHEQKIENFSTELKTICDEVIFLRRKLDTGKNQETSPEFKKLLTRIKQLEADRVEYKFNLALKARQIQELKAEVSRMKKSWWRRWFRKL